MKKFTLEKNEILNNNNIKNKLDIQKELNKRNDYLNTISKFSSVKDFSNTGNLGNLEFKSFYVEIVKNLKDENIDIAYLEKCLKMIELKHASNNNNNLGFRFLVLLHQILFDSSLEVYRNKFNNEFVTIGFDHLICLFKENFHKLNYNAEDLMLNNFLYFMIINKGEFSDVLTKICSISDKFNNKINGILTQQIRIKSNENSKINYNNLIDYESNYRSAPSEITNDYSFKYRDYNYKTALYNNLVAQKQNINKMKFLINSSNQLNNEYLNNIDEIEKLITTFLLKDAKNIFDEELLKITNELSRFNNLIKEIAYNMTDLKILDYNNINLNNIENFYDPLFSGEKNFQTQFFRVASVLGNESAEKLFNKFLQEHKKHKSYSFKDLFNLNLILNKHDNSSISDIFFNVYIENNKYYANIDSTSNLNKQHFILTKNETQIFNEDFNSVCFVMRFCAFIKILHNMF